MLIKMMTMFTMMQSLCLAFADDDDNDDDDNDDGDDPFLITV